MPKKLKDRIRENQKTVKKGLHGKIIMDGGEDNKFKKVVLLRILNISKKNDEIRENEENSSPISKTRLKQGSKEIWENSSNLYKTTVKQSIDGSLGCCANRPMGVSSPMSKTSPK